MKEEPKSTAGKKSEDALNDWIKNVSPNKVINNAQRIVSTAVDVLEEEIAAGILAAKQLEKKVINVDEVRSGAPEELMSRIRRDAHDAVDLFMDAVTALTHQITQLTQAANGNGQKSTAPAKSTEISVVQNDVPAKPGQRVSLPLLVTNHSTEKAIQIQLAKSELIGPQGIKIQGRWIEIVPNGFLLAPAEAKEIVIAVSIPATCKPGTYSGLFQDVGNPQIKTVVTIEVA